MFDPNATDRQLAAAIVQFTRATSKDLRRLSNIAAIAAEIKHERETGRISPAPAPTEPPKSETPSGHHLDCQWHCDQNHHECTCGFIPSAQPAI